MGTIFINSENSKNSQPRVLILQLTDKLYLKRGEKKTGYYLELLTTETIKLLGRIENKTTKDKNSKHVPHFKITEVVLVYFNIVNNDYQRDSRVLCTFVLNKPFGSLLKTSPKKSYLFKNILF